MTIKAALITPGPRWNIELEHGDEFVSYRVEGKEPNGVAEANCAFIESAVNACFALNPTDPLAAAQHLEALVKAARVMLYRYLSLVESGDCGYWEAETDEEVIQVRAALSRVTGKP